jgi:hypothetical protein
MILCKYCKYFEEHDDEFALCRRYAPRPVLVAEDEACQMVIMWPEVRPGDSCGEGEAVG